MDRDRWVHRSMSYKERLREATKLGRNMSDKDKLDKLAENYNISLSTLRYRLQNYDRFFKFGRNKPRRGTSMMETSVEFSDISDEESLLQTSDLSDDMDNAISNKNKMRYSMSHSYRIPKFLYNRKRVIIPGKLKKTNKPLPPPIVISSDSDDSGNPNQQKQDNNRKLTQKRKSHLYRKYNKKIAKKVPELRIQFVETEKMFRENSEHASTDDESEKEESVCNEESILRRQALGLRTKPKKFVPTQIQNNKGQSHQRRGHPSTSPKMYIHKTSVQYSSNSSDIAKKVILPTLPSKPKDDEILPIKTPSGYIPFPKQSVVNYEKIENFNTFTTNRESALAQVQENKISLNDICLVCGTTQNVTTLHPVFEGGLCEPHHSMFAQWYMNKDHDGYYSYCSICSMGEEVILCTNCDRCYCEICVDQFGREGLSSEIKKMDEWSCILCSTSTNDYALLKIRPDWKNNIENFQFRKDGNDPAEFKPFYVPPPIPEDERKPIRVLSLFDGISTGLVALKKLGFKIETFVASEIDEHAIKLVRNNHNNLVLQIGDITKVTDEKLRNLGPFDLLLGGSPCNDLSGANPRRRGLFDFEGTGCLFFHFYRALKAIEPEIITTKESMTLYQAKYVRPFFWLFENVSSMRRIDKSSISNFLQCNPTFADAKHVSAACRPRLFWGNIPGLPNIEITPSEIDKLTVQECLEPGRTARFDKVNTITCQYKSLFQGQNREFTVLDEGKMDVLWTTEIERIFGVPQHYTDINNLGPRERLMLLGKSWSVPVVMQLLQPITEYFLIE